MDIFGIICIAIASVIGVFMIFLIWCLMRVSGRASRLEEEHKNNGGAKDVQ